MCKIKKQFFSICFVLLLIFFNCENVYADTIASAQLVNYSKILSPALVAVAPEVALVACVLVGAGIAYENREQIISTAGTIYNDIVSAGIPFARDSVTGAINLTEQIRDFIIGDAIEMQIAFSILSTSTSTFNKTLTFFYTCTYIDGQVVKSSVNIFVSGAYTLYNYIYTPTGSTIYGIKSPGGMVFDIAGTSTLSTFTIDKVMDGSTQVGGQSVCTTLPNTMFPTNSIDVPTATASIPVGSISVPQDTSLDLPLIGAIGFTGALERIGAVPYTGDTTGDTTGDIPIDITDTTVPSDISLNWAPLQIGVTDKFPFCIPFDLINLLKPFSAERVAPVFTVTFPSIYNMSEGSFDIDFSKFSKLAAMLRFFILVMFSYSLIIKTRDLIKG